MNRINNTFDVTKPDGKDRWIAAAVTEYIWLNGRSLPLSNHRVSQMLLAAAVGTMPDEIAERIAAYVRSN